MPNVLLGMGNPAGVKRDFKALERRRLRALRLLDKGLSQSAVGRRLGVAQQSVSRSILRGGRLSALASAKPIGSASSPKSG